MTPHRPARQVEGEDDRTVLRAAAGAGAQAEVHRAVAVGQRHRPPSGNGLDGGARGVGQLRQGVGDDLIGAGVEDRQGAVGRIVVSGHPHPLGAGARTLAPDTESFLYEDCQRPHVS
ncbi:MAG: hypothetical protein Q4C85_05735 [Actinomyces sp.]|uniref:hypothetical protein n=1 Tax=Actinomyces sp. TaxID=29317 RepID=UPI0026DC16E0|nr:hypothetical protein [Actinomyces sp.]MDO4243252.1 hypothetical protein [Actinomyces sp.]